MTTTKRLSRRQQREIAERLFSLYIRQRDRFCRRCGSNVHLQAAHIHSRSYRAIQFAEDNCIALCRGCHLWFDKHPIEKRRLACEWIGEERYYELERQAVGYQRVDLDAVLDWLRTEVA